jgi:molecular chaperone DnaK (HSP70)
MPHSGKSGVIGLDLNATRARAVAGDAGSLPQEVPLEGPSADMPLALSLENRKVEVGSPGFGLIRRLPHLACAHFLGQLGTDRQWSAGRHRLDPARALALVFDRLRTALAGHHGVALAVPAYLTVAQVETASATALRAKLPLLGIVPTPLAAALIAYAEQPWSGAALVADIDDHALTWSVVQIEGGQARLLATEAWPLLSLRAWRERLLDVLADRCVRQSRRDPRDSGDAEQSLYEQIDPILEVCRHGQMAEAAVQTTQWYQNLVVQPVELADACVHLIRQTVDAMSALQTATLRPGGTGAVLLTDAVARLPGLAAAVEKVASPPPAPQVDAEDDFSAGLLDAMNLERASLYLLTTDAIARAAHALAGRWERRELPPGRIDAAPLLPPPPPDAGPPRLHFRGQEFVLAATVFMLGRHPNCDLVFDSDLYPAVSARHCEILQDRLGYLLRDHSRHGTLLNDRPVTSPVTLHPGDWIRLGPNGPVLRFLGRTAEQRRLMTTA